MPARAHRKPLFLACLLALLLGALGAQAASAGGHRVGRAILIGDAQNQVPVGIKARLAGRDDADLAAVLTRLRGTGVSIVREDVPWSTIEPQPGTYYWGEMDRWVAATARQGIGVMAVLASPPTWVSGHWNVPPSGGDQAGAFARFTRDVVARYGEGGGFWRAHPELPAQPIRYWDVWNEPYESRFWADATPDPGAYARLFKAVAQAGHSADPDARFMLEADTRVVSSGWPWKPFLAAMFDAVPDLGRYAYGVSIHPYQGDGGSPRSCSPDTRYAGVSSRWQATAMQFCRLLDIRHILDANDAAGTKIWITEIGWSTAPEGDRAVSETTQADDVRQVFELLRTRYRDLVSGLIWYEYQGPESDPSELGDYLGLVHADGTPKPAWPIFAAEAARGI